MRQLRTIATIISQSSVVNAFMMLARAYTRRTVATKAKTQAPMATARSSRLRLSVTAIVV